MFTGDEIADTFTNLGLTHVIWIPDTTLGQWDAALLDAENLKLVQVCREGEAWAIAAGLYLGRKAHCLHPVHRFVRVR